MYIIYSVSHCGWIGIGIWAESFFSFPYCHTVGIVYVRFEVAEWL